MDSKFQPPAELSEVQLQVLLLTMSSPSDAATTDMMRSNQKIAIASQVLASKGLIQSSQSGTVITDAGIQMLDQMNVIDKQGRRTPYGEELFTKAVALNNGQVSESWPLISLVSQHAVS